MPPNGVISVRADACVRIVFDAQMYQTTFKLSVPAHEYVAVFAQHSRNTKGPWTRSVLWMN